MLSSNISKAKKACNGPQSLPYRIEPTKAQQHLLDAMLEECRWLYNEVLATRKQVWEEYQQSVSRNDTITWLSALKDARPTLKDVHSQVLQKVCIRVDLAFEAFFRRVKAGENPGYLRFKQFGRYDSMTYPQFGNGAKIHTTWRGRTVLQVPPEVTVQAGSGKIQGGSGFIANDGGFSDGTLTPGNVAVYTLDAVVKPTTQASMATFSMEVNANGVVSIPVVGRMRIVPTDDPPLPPAAWMPLVLR